MLNEKVQNLFSFLILVSLFRTVRTDSNNLTETRNIFGANVKTTAFFSRSVVDDKFYDCKPKKLNGGNLKLYDNSEKDSYRVEEPEIRPLRKTRNINLNGTVVNYGVECLSCYANASTKWNCYAGISVPSVKCADVEHCFIELNPQYIRRGCILPGRVNRTFVCKCPLCNDKPSFDIHHYEYRHINDWEFDNARLLTPIVGMDLICKVCETKGTNPTSDKNCRLGRNADYMVCPENQLCYTNIDDESDFVSRGCSDRPMLNSMYFFCNKTICNIEEFPNPAQRTKLLAEAIKLKTEHTTRGPMVLKSFGSKSCRINLWSTFMVTLTITQCIINTC